MNKNGYDFKKDDQTVEHSDGYLMQYFENRKSQHISIAVVTDPQTTLISMVSAGVPLDLSNMDETNALITAATLVYGACHGAMTNEKWTALNDSMEYTMKGPGYLTRSFCD